jgi:hypothetical protein
VAFAIHACWKISLLDAAYVPTPLEATIDMAHDATNWPLVEVSRLVIDAPVYIEIVAVDPAAADMLNIPATALR